MRLHGEYELTLKSFIIRTEAEDIESRLDLQRETCE